MNNKKGRTIKITVGIVFIFIVMFICIYNYNKVVNAKKTLFIYMCGSNLETKQGLAGKNIDELLAASIDNDINIVIETGGAKIWRSHDIDNNAIQRYEIKNGELNLIETLDYTNMGEENTLSNFLEWGLKKYPSDHNMLILWDHGKGPAGGVCFDENYNFDSLSLNEIKTAFDNVKLKNKFEILGFDACLMASIETASYMKDYADYMIASEEIEPSGGWNYKELIEAYANNDNLIEVGKTICDTYMEKCKSNDKGDYPTLSVFDLSYTDQMLLEFDNITKIIGNDIFGKENTYSTEAIHSCEKFGRGTSSQGNANLFDIIGYLSETSKYIDLDYTNIYNLCKDKFICYKVSNEKRNVCGVSFFYPEVYNEKEIQSYIELNVSNNYNKFLKDVYLNVPKKTIEYTDKGKINDNGAFAVSLSEEGIEYFSAINFTLMSKDDKGKKHILYTDNDITKDWENLVFQSNFRGISMALNGHRLYYNTLSSSEENVEFTAPIIVNGEKTNLRFEFEWNENLFNGGEYHLLGTWKGYDENGLPDNDIVPLKKGDKVKVVTDIVLENGEQIENFSEEFIIGDDGGKITELPLDKKIYQYVFEVTDIFGNTFVSNMATFEMTVNYEELLNNPLPDRTFAAKVTNIEEYK